MWIEVKVISGHSTALRLLNIDHIIAVDPSGAEIENNAMLLLDDWFEIQMSYLEFKKILADPTHPARINSAPPRQST